MVTIRNKNIGIQFQKENYENVDCPFTELLSLLKSYKPTQSGLELVYSPQALQAMHQHADNAMKSLLFGLQALGHVLGVLNEKGEESPIYASSLGFLVQFITNLIEAMHQLCTDISHEFLAINKQIPTVLDKKLSLSA